MNYSNVASYLMPRVEGLPERYAKDLKNLFAVLTSKAHRNAMRSRYYYGHEVLKNIGIAVHDENLMRDAYAVVGWPAKAVDSLANRSNFVSYTAQGTAADELNGIANDNRLAAGYDMAVTSELTHSLVAYTVTRGEDGPVIRPHSATTCALLWDYEKNRVRCGLTVAMTDDKGRPTMYNQYEDEAVITYWLSDTKRGTWSYQIQPQPASRPFIEPLVYKPSLERPFGVSRITRQVMDLTDMAVRTSLRSELTSELFSSPQKWIMGAPDDLFEPMQDDVEDDEPDEDDAPAHPVMTKWEAAIGAILAISKDEDGDTPTVGQFASGSMQPHIDYMRSLAAQFSGATDVPISELGVIHDNPSSAEAIYAAKEPLIAEAERLNKGNGNSLLTIGQMALAIADNTSFDRVRDRMDGVDCYFLSPSRASLAERTDAMQKQAAVTPYITRSRVYWEQLGYSAYEIDAFMAEGRKAGNNSILSSLMGGGGE